MSAASSTSSAVHRAGDRRQPPSALADRLLLRRLFRRCGRLWFAGGGDGGDADRLSTRLQASGLSLVMNTAPVAFGALRRRRSSCCRRVDRPAARPAVGDGRPPIPRCAILVPFWLLWAYCGWRRTLEAPAVWWRGLSFAIAQLHGVEPSWPVADGGRVRHRLDHLAGHLPAVYYGGPSASCTSMGALRRATTNARRRSSIRRPAGGSCDGGHQPGNRGRGRGCRAGACHRGSVTQAWTPWLILTVLVFLWGLPATKAFLDGIFRPAIVFSGLDGVVQRVPPVVAKAVVEPAVYNLSLLSASGTAILLAGLISGLVLGAKPLEIAATYGGRSGRSCRRS